MTESATLSRAFLGVERSVLGRSWRARLDAAGEARALAMVQRHGHADLLARVMAGRGVTADAAPAYLDAKLRELMPDPSVLQDMDAAVERLAHAVRRGERIAIFGDYDVDGACSAALLADFLAACGTPHRIHIPDRLFEGYGPNVEAVRMLTDDGCALLVAVDCGTTSHAALEEAARLGLDPIVLDHHQAGADLPPALIVNPNRQDDLSGLGQLCAAGVVFMTLVALARKLRADGFFTTARPPPDLLLGLDLVALATVADVAPLTGLNRAFVSKGLAVMRTRARPGLKALFDIAAAIGPPRPYHLGFLIGPRINAGGRIGDAALGARLLTLHDEAEAARIAQELDSLNRERQAIEAATLEAAHAEALAQAGLAAAQHVVVTAAEGWHPGVVGLVASRLREKFGCPAFAIAITGGVATGSGRSVPGVDLGRIVRAAVEAGILVKGGGHAMAAGITLDPARLAEFHAFLAAALDGAPVAENTLLVDAALTAAGAEPRLLEEIERAGPFGASNPEPVFVLPAHRLTDVAPVGNGHIRLRAVAGDGARLDAIAFRVAGEPLGKALVALRDAPVHLAGSLALDQWGGRTRVQLRILDVAPAPLARGGATG